ncbi:hypothetical protein CFP56_007932 [Quercus suber]|uniref:Uncharacterized protein n=1 Tax=Quercus suber TaxID=58331 RepID=A0AAW0L5Y9_QUESU
MALGFVGDWPRPFVIIEFVGDGWWDSSRILWHQPCGYLAFSQGGGGGENDPRFGCVDFQPEPSITWLSSIQWIGVDMV